MNKYKLYDMFHFIQNQCLLKQSNSTFEYNLLQFPSTQLTS